MLQSVVDYRNLKVEANTPVAKPEKQVPFPGFQILLPAILDEIVRLVDADGAILIRYDALQAELHVELASSAWSCFSGLQIKPLINITGLMSSSGQVEIDLGRLLLLDPTRTNPNSSRVLIHTPLFTNGQNLGAVWLGHHRKVTSEELLSLSSIGGVIADVLYCLSRDTQKLVTPLEIIQALVRLLSAWDIPTYHHSIRTVSWSRSTARHLGLDEEEVEIIGWAALLHDIGKLGIPKSILHKPGPLTKQEWKVIKLHPKLGARLLDHIQSLARVKAIILAHHEHVGGSGYPQGLIGESIPIGARIVAVVDAYTAMTEEHAYRPAMTHEQTVQEIRNCSGTHFDPLVANAFLDQFH